MGERTPLAAVDAPASGRMAVGEAHHQPARRADRAARASSCRATGWPPAARPGEDAALYDTVEAVGMELCPRSGISVPVGKDSLSMRTRWTDPARATRGR